MTEQHTVEPVHACPVQIFPNHVFVAAITSAIKQPIRVSRSDMNSRACAEIQHRHLGGKLFRPMRLLNIKMSTGHLCKQLDDPQNELGQTPVGIIENDSEPWQ